MRTLFIKFAHLIMFFFSIFPIKNRVLLSCYDGDSITDNILYLINEFELKEIKYVFIASNRYKGEKNKIVKKYSLRFFYLIETSKIVITNMNLPKGIVKRRGQIFINTWHGAGGLKGYINKDCDYNIYDYFVSESEFDTKNFMKPTARNFKNEIMKIGMPRNDILYLNSNKRKESIKSLLNIPPNSFIILYAPTMRVSTQPVYINDFEKIKYAIKNKFGKDAIVLIRNHHFQKKFGETLSSNDKTIIDVSFYIDMQELLLVSDILITDYSSCAWDFSIMMKPVFLYIPDYVEYFNSCGKPFADYEHLPFFISYNLDSLIKNIYLYDKTDYENKIKKYFAENGKYSNKGDSSEKLALFCKNILES